MIPAGISAAVYAAAALAVVCGAVWGISALRSAGATAQQAKDLAITDKVTHAELVAETAAPHDPAAVARELRAGHF